MQKLTTLVDLLVCPETKQGLQACSQAEAGARMQKPLAALRDEPWSKGSPSQPFGATPQVLLRHDLQCAYPVVDGVPILIVPEMLGVSGHGRRFDLRDPMYAEAYEEMAFYNEVSSREAQNILTSQSYASIEPVVDAEPEATDSFPKPRGVWLDAIYDCAAQWDAYSHIAPIQGKRVMQLGGKGAHAVKLLLAGASEAWAVTPMLGEARCAIALAQAVGVADRLRCVVAIAEELPFAENSFDAIYSGGCLHHMVTSAAMPEAARILNHGGKFAATDAWRAPLYSIGTKLLGKREPNAYCRPLSKERVAPLKQAFSTSEVVQHGTLTRYLLLALNKFGVSSTLSTAWRLNKIDDAICSLIPGLRRMGSSVVCLGTKE